MVVVRLVVALAARGPLIKATRVVLALMALVQAVAAGLARLEAQTGTRLAAMVLPHPSRALALLAVVVVPVAVPVKVAAMVEAVPHPLPVR